MARPREAGREAATAFREGFTLVEGSCFAASPAGMTNRADYEFLRDEILGQLKAALPVCQPFGGTVLAPLLGIG